MIKVVYMIGSDDVNTVFKHRCTSFSFFPDFSRVSPAADNQGCRPVLSIVQPFKSRSRACWVCCDGCATAVAFLCAASSGAGGKLEVYGFFKVEILWYASKDADI